MSESVERKVSRGERGAVPVQSLEQEAVVSLLRTAFMVRRRLEEEMHRRGITGQQYNVLRILRGSADPLPIMTLGSRMIEPEPGITRMVRRLEAKGVLSRATSPADARKSFCAVTERGLRILAELDEPMARTNREITEGLDSTDLETLIDLLRRIGSHVSPAGVSA